VAAPNGTASAVRKTSWQAWKARNRDKINLKQNESRRNNREAYNAYERERRKAVPEREAAKRRRGYEKRRTLILELKNKPCMDCGIQYLPCAMDFDHVRGQKLFGIAHAYNTTIEALLFESSKCDVVCANCHRVRTHLKDG
jgi:hypothetical protein